jgi:hypothetical protein
MVLVYIFLAIAILVCVPLYFLPMDTDNYDDL